MDDKFTYDVSEEGGQEAEDVDSVGGKSEPPKTFLSVVEGIGNERKCLMRLHFENKMMAETNKLGLTVMECATEHILQSY